MSCLSRCGLPALVLVLSTACTGTVSKDEATESSAASESESEVASQVSDTEETETSATGDTDCVLTSWYEDADGDGFGDEFGFAVEACEAPSGHVDNALDCDDDEATVHPDATETFYDGVDQDCDGGSDYDSDGDGDDAEAHGGTDCDDEDPSSHGSGVEGLDGADNDCDGSTDEELAMADVANCQILHSVPETFGLRVLGGGDVNDDGYSDVLVRSINDQFLFYGPLTGTLFSSAGSRVSDAAVFAGDHDGDGVDDLLVRSSSYPAATVHVVPGPFSGNVNASVSSTATIETTSAYAFGSSLAGVDLDADGFGDVITSDYTGTGTVYVFYGPLSGSLTPGDADTTVSGDRSGDYLGYRLTGTPDVDGDGSDEVLVGAPGASSDYGKALVLAGGLSGDVGVDDAFAVFTGSSSSDGLGELVVPGGDANNDGYGDLVVCGDDCETVYVFAGGPLGGAQASSAALATLSMDGVLGGRQDNATALDFDGDDVLDIAMGEPSRDLGGSADYDGTVWLALGPVSGAVDMESELGLGGSEESLGYSLGAVDIDGDGFDDLLATSPLDDGASADGGAVYLLLGRAL